MVRHKPLGVIQLSSQVSHRFVSTDAELLFLVANTIGIATENADLLEDLLLSNAEISNAYDTTLTGWSRALDLKDAQTEGHAQRVVNLTLAMARAFGVPNEELVHIRRGALLHDIGKMAIPDHILLKPGTLTPDEWSVMRKHPAYAIELLGPISYLRPALDIPYCHHEKWDGTGYPQGLAGEAIPLAARIFAIADVWDALTYDRPYRKAWSKERARKHIEQLAGSHFDPQVVQCFLTLSKDANPADSNQVLALTTVDKNEMCQVTV
jgi:putative nucleotidyltransferase with HDIG domain